MANPRRTTPDSQGSNVVPLRDNWDRFEWYNAIIDESDLPSTTRLVLLTLFRFMNSDGACWPSVSKLAEGTGLTRRTVGAHLERAEEAGWIDRVRDHGGVPFTYFARNPVDDDTPEANSQGCERDSQGGESDSHPDTKEIRRGANEDRTGCERDSGGHSSEQSIQQSKEQSNTNTPHEGEHEPEATDTPAEEPFSDQWLMDKLDDYGLNPSITEVMKMTERLEVSDVESDDYKKYTLDQLSSFEQKVQSGEKRRSEVKSWFGRSDNVGWWLENKKERDDSGPDTLDGRYQENSDFLQGATEAAGAAQ